MATPSAVPDGTGVIEYDPYLAPFELKLRERYARLQILKREIDFKEQVGMLLLLCHRHRRRRRHSPRSLLLQGIDKFTRGYEWFGFHREQEVDGRWGIRYREWIPAATQAFLMGDFSTNRCRAPAAAACCLPLLLLVVGGSTTPSHTLAIGWFDGTDGWNRESHPLERGDFGVWSIFLPDRPDGASAIPHNSKLKVRSCILVRW